MTKDEIDAKISNGEVFDTQTALREIIADLQRQPDHSDEDILELWGLTVGGGIACVGDGQFVAEVTP